MDFNKIPLIRNIESLIRNLYEYLQTKGLPHRLNKMSIHTRKAINESNKSEFQVGKGTFFVSHLMPFWSYNS